MTEFFNGYTVYFQFNNKLKIRNYGNIQTEIPPFHRRRQAGHYVFPSDSPQKYENGLHRLPRHARRMGRADFVHPHHRHTGTAGGTATDCLQTAVGLQANHLADHGKGTGNAGIHGGRHRVGTPPPATLPDLVQLHPRYGGEKAPHRPIRYRQDLP